MRPGITACIVCRDEADRLGACLESLAWTDAIVVLDLESSDESATLAAAAGARVVRHAPVPIVESVRNVVAGFAETDWILVVDPDERVTPGLAEGLRAASHDASIDAVIVPRMNCDFGFEPSHWTQRYEPQLRMYRRSAVTWPTRPNALPRVPEDRVRRIPRRDDFVLVHDRSRSIAEVLERSVRYAPIQARAMLDDGIEFSAAAMASALGREIRTKLLEPRAWRDGLPGLMRAGVLVGFKFYVWAEFWRISGVGRSPRDARTVRTAAVIGESARTVIVVAGVARRIRRRLARALAPARPPERSSAEPSDAAIGHLPDRRTRWRVSIHGQSARRRASATRS